MEMTGVTLIIGSVSVISKDLFFNIFQWNVAYLVAETINRQ
jgi:hypothetical protein